MRLCATALPILLLGMTLSSHAQVVESGPLRVGAAKTDVTPPKNHWPAQYLGVLDRVYSRAIVIDNGVTSAALVTVDVISMPTSMWERLSKRIETELRIPAKNLVLAGTGTHSVPMGRSGQGSGPIPQVESGEFFDDQIFDSVKLAQEKLQPARMSYGTGVSYINVNRDRIDPVTRGWWEGPNRDGTSDKTVAVIKFSSPRGEPIAVYYNYAVFNVITGTLDLISGDITNAASRYIEESFDDRVVAALSLGAHGDQNPVYYQQTFDLREIRTQEYAKRGHDIANAMPPPGGVGLNRKDPTVAKLMNQQKQMTVSMGQLLGEEVLHVMRSSARDESTAQIYANHKTITCPGRERTNEGRAGFAGTYRDAGPQEIRLGVLMIGDVAVGQVNGIPYNAIGQRLKRESPYAKTMLTTRANGMTDAGYIPDDASYGHNTFAVLSSKLKPGCAESAIVNGIIDLMPPIAYSIGAESNR